MSWWADYTCCISCLNLNFRDALSHLTLLFDHLESWKGNNYQVVSKFFFLLKIMQALFKVKVLWEYEMEMQGNIRSLKWDEKGRECVTEVLQRKVSCIRWCENKDMRVWDEECVLLRMYSYRWWRSGRWFGAQHINWWCLLSHQWMVRICGGCGWWCHKSCPLMTTLMTVHIEMITHTWPKGI